MQESGAAAGGWSRDGQTAPRRPRPRRPPSVDTARKPLTVSRRPQRVCELGPFLIQKPASQRNKEARQREPASSAMRATCSAER